MDDELLTRLTEYASALSEVRVRLQHASMDGDGDPLPHLTPSEEVLVARIVRTLVGLEDLVHGEIGPRDDAPF